MAEAVILKKILEELWKMRNRSGGGTGTVCRTRFRKATAYLRAAQAVPGFVARAFSNPADGTLGLPFTL